MPEIVCPSCSAVNRVPAEKPAAGARCGRCSHALFDGHPAALDGASFSKQVARSGIPVLVDFWAAWCGPCRAMAPEFEKAARALEPHVRLAKLDTDAAPEESAANGIRSIPTMILFRDGQEIARQSGALAAGQIVQWVRESLRG